MTRDDIIRMACEAGAYSPNNPDDYAFSVKELGRFAALVISHHVKETRPEVADSMGKWLQQIAYQHGGIGDLSRTEMEFGAMVAAAEREACAEVCEMQMNAVVARHPARIEFDPDNIMAQKCAAAIRNRGTA